MGGTSSSKHKKPNEGNAASSQPPAVAKEQHEPLPTDKRTQPNRVRWQTLQQRRQDEQTDTQPIILQQKKDTSLVVAAIDFGTTYSGYAFSFRHDPGEMFTSYFRGIVANGKTSTVVLLNRDKTIHSFGQDAVDKYLQLLDDDDHKGWYFFEKFKMKLFVQTRPLERNMELEDIEGKKMPAIEIFAEVLKYMKQYMMKRIQNVPLIQQSGAVGQCSVRSVLNVTESDVHWILTVPAIWNDSSKQFMREAAEKAGIDGEFLSLALEPEVASLFCCHTPSSGLTLKEGTKYLVLDLGGGTADIIAHEMNKDGSLTELHLATGGDFGGTAVDNGFRNMLISLLGGKVFDIFRKNHTSDYFQLMKNFERKKIYFDGTKQIRITFPVSALHVLKDEDGLDVTELLQNSPLKGRLQFKKDKLEMTAELVKEFFDAPVKRVLDHTDKLLQKVHGLDHVILVGGFSESPYLLSAARRAFGSLILEPKEPSLAVLKGAVMYGQKGLKIKSRVCKYTYGIARMMKFKDHHPPEKRRMIGDTAYCDDLFNKHIEIGQQVKIDEDQEPQAYYPTLSHMKQAVLEVYASTERDPKFVTDQSCTFVGLLRIDIPDYKHDLNWKINVTLKFGGTELLVEVHEVRTSFDFLG